MPKFNDDLRVLLFLLQDVEKRKSPAAKKNQTVIAKKLLEKYEDHEELMPLKQCLKAFGVSFEGDNEVPLLEVRYHTSPDEFGKYFNNDLYKKSYALCHFAQQIELTGIEEEKATKLAVMFNNSKTMITYLAEHARSNQYSTNVIEDACAFQLPDFKQQGFLDEKEGCKFEYFKNLAVAENNLLRKDFKELLPFAWNIQKLITLKRKSSLLEGKEKEVKKIEEKKRMIAGLVTTFENLEKHKKEVIGQKADIYHSLANEISDNYVELAHLLSGKFLKDLSFIELKAFIELYKVENFASYRMFIENGIPAEYFQEFCLLDRQDASVNIPEVMIEGDTIGHSGYYLMKVPVWDEMQAARAACFGKMTNCCQSLSGEAGHNCVIYGLTNPNGGFYVLCRGDSHNPKVTDPIVAQSWACRTKTGAILLDSIEVPAEVKTNPELTNLVCDFYKKLGRELVINHDVSKVACGKSNSGLTSSIGTKSVFNKKEIITDYKGYHDSNTQSVLYDKENPFDTIENEDELRIILKQLVDSANEDSSKPLKNNPGIIAFINWAILNEDSESILKKLNEYFEGINREMEVQDICESMERYINNLEGLDIQGVIKNSNDFIFKDVKDEKGATALMVAAYQGNIKIVRFLLENKADVNVETLRGTTALMEVAKIRSNDSIQILNLLLEAGADPDAINEHRQSALFHAIDNRLLESSLLLIDHTKKFSPTSDILINLAADNGLESVCVKILNSIGYENYHEHNASNEKAFMLLVKAINNNMENLAEALIENNMGINLPNNNNITPLMACLSRRNYVLAEKLIDKGAIISSLDLNSLYIDNVPETLIVKAAMNSPDSIPVNMVNRILLSAVTQGNIQLCTLLINKHKPDLNTILDKDRNSCLTIAARNGHLKICELLLENGANIFQLYEENPTVLIEARKSGNEDLVKFFSKKIVFPPGEFNYRLFNQLVILDFQDLALKLLDNCDKPEEILNEMASELDRIPEQWIDDISKVCVFLLKQGVKPSEENTTRLKKINHKEINEELTKFETISFSHGLHFSRPRVTKSEKIEPPLESGSKLKPK